MSLQTTILSMLKMAESASESIEKTMEKGEIARWSNLSFSQCFQKIVLQTSKTQVLFGKGLKNSIVLRWQPGIKFCEQFLKRTSQGAKFGPNWLSGLGCLRHTTDTLKAPLEHVVLR